MSGRGRLSSIDLLPEEAEPDIAWAMEQLRERSMLQSAILEEFNARLADRGIGPISKSAFNRHSIRLARTARRLEETRAIAKVLNERMPEATDDLTIMVAETIKTLIFELLEDGGKLTPRNAMEMARAMKDVALAQGLSTQRRRVLEKEFADKAGEAIDAAGKAAGLSAERISQLRREFLGVPG
ncbi:DUF3486 family protein [Afifella pfennigii]|uniref:DUF3486 family protein n=1 Tax=Afifella pfennigii TaxID=209897 RepID=UPI00047A78B0|nr:DUF3486 family protein [Afifella pfennigii]